MGIKAYKPNSQEIIYQFIDGEYILLNLSNGNYFSLDNLGVLIWECVMNSVSVEEFTAAVAESLPADSTAITDSFNAVFTALKDEGLAIPAEEANPDPSGFIADVRSRIGQGGFLFQPAHLHSYKNIQEKYAHPCGVKEI